MIVLRGEPNELKKAGEDVNGRRLFSEWFGSIKSKLAWIV